MKQTTARKWNESLNRLGFALSLFLLFSLFPAVPQAADENPTNPAPTISGDIFGKEGGYFHPFLSIAEEYTDNIYNTRNDKKSDFINTLSPGIWLAFPGSKKKVATIETSPLLPAGLSYSRYASQAERRLQGYFFYKSDFQLYADRSDENTTSHRLEGMGRYNLRGGLSIGVMDQFEKSQLPRSSTLSSRSDDYKGNLIGLNADYDVTPKLTLSVDWLNYIVTYDADRNRLYDRMDNSASGYVFFKVLPRTSFFVQYERTDVNYDKTILSDSQEQRFFGGVEWKMTAKSSGRLKGGYAITDFDDPDIKNDKNFTFETQLDYRFTPHTSLRLLAFRRDTQSVVSNTVYATTHSIGALYVQRLPHRITAQLDLRYLNDDYQGELIVGGKAKHRQDDYYRFRPSVEYAFRKWLSAGLEYTYAQRNSDISEFDYTTNTILFRVRGSL